MSSVTKTLNLIKPEATDNMSPAIFASNFDILDSEIDNLKKDYVIAQGSQGSWEYRRWASGIAECWIGSYVVNLAFGAQWGGAPNIYSGDIASPGDYPFTFVSTPLVLPTFASIVSNVNVDSFPLWARSDGTKTKCPSFRAICPSKVTGNVLTNIGSNSMTTTLSSGGTQWVKLATGLNSTYSCIATNGDWNANPFRVRDTCMQGADMWVELEEANSGSIRINYTMFPTSGNVAVTPGTINGVTLAIYVKGRWK